MPSKMPMTEERKRELAKRFGPSHERFMGCVYWTQNRCVLIHRRLHATREYICCRIWQKHRVMGHWYPSKRSFIVPMDRAKQIGNAVLGAAAGIAEDKPDWLVEREKAESEQIEEMPELGAPSETVETAEVVLERERRERV